MQTRSEATPPTRQGVPKPPLSKPKRSRQFSFCNDIFVSTRLGVRGEDCTYTQTPGAVGVVEQDPKSQTVASEQLQTTD